MLIPVWGFVLPMLRSSLKISPRRHKSVTALNATNKCDSIKRQLDGLIGNAALSLGSFAAQGPVPPGIAVTCAGVGRLGLPFTREQSVTLISKMTQAPFGKGAETIVDVDVRRAWEMNGADVTLNAHWTDVLLPDVVTDACEQIGLDAERLGVQAHLYKLLCYEEGGHFKKHRDTEKEKGMFGTLIVQLPSEHTGGDLCIEHNGEQLRFSFAESSADDSRYAVFYADCEHIIEPVTSGFRLALVYNLVRTAADGVAADEEPTAASINATTTQLASVLDVWSRTEEAPKKMAYVLHHMYTDANFGFEALKGKDRQVVEMLRQARVPDGTGGSRPLMEVRLAMLEKYEYGLGPRDFSPYDNYLPQHGSRDDDEDWMRQRRLLWDIKEFDYVRGSTITTKEWSGPDGPVDLDMSIDIDTELLNADPSSAFFKLPSRHKFEGWTGNSGYELEHWYQTGVVCFWPAERKGTVKDRKDVDRIAGRSNEPF